MKRFVLGCLGLATFGVLVFGVVVFLASSTERKRLAAVVTSTPGPSMREEQQAADRRKFLTDDDSELGFRSRRNFFELSLRNADLRCGDVTEMAMVRSGRWRVMCSTGRAYLFTFDKNGQHTGTLTYRR